MPTTTTPDRRAAARADNHRKILGAARRLFAERGFAGTTVQQVASETGLALQTVFNHFPRKEQLFFHGRCPWMEISEHLESNPDRYTSAPELIATVSAMVSDHLHRLADPPTRPVLEELLADPDLVLWERGVRQRAAQAIAVHIARHAQPAIAAQADRCGALTVAEAGTVVDGHRRAVLDRSPDLDAVPAPGAGVLVERLTDLRTLLLQQAAGPAAAH